MKLRNLFLTAAATLTLSFGAAFSANAALIKQSFGLEFLDYTATLEIGVLTENDDPFFDFSWADDGFEFINVIGLSGPGVSQPNSFFTGADFGSNSAISFFEAIAYEDAFSGSGIENGFESVDIEFALDVFSDLTGTAFITIFNDSEQTVDITIEAFENDQIVIDEFGFGSVVVGSVEVNSPAVVLLMALSIGGLLLTRRK